MKNRKWLLEVQLEKGTGVNQVKVGELMDGGKTDDECKEIISTLLEAGETREYNENVFLRLGEFEGATKEEAFNNYFEAFDGDDQNELFFMHQIDAVELAVECGCGGNCSTSDNMAKLKDAKDLIDSMSNEFKFIADDETIADAIDSGELFIQEKVTAWNETSSRYKK